jgi:hypothetical protein
MYRVLETLEMSRLSQLPSRLRDTKPIYLRILIAIGSLGVWISLWTTPWQSWLAAWPWVRLIMSILMFAFPGALLLQLVSKQPPTRPSHHLTVGFAVSVALTSLLGLVAKVAHFPFQFITTSLLTLGGIGLLVLTLRAPAPRVNFEAKTQVKTLAAALPFLAAILLAGGLAVPPELDGDDYIYGGYITAYEYSESLNFDEVFFGTGHIGHIRFWLSGWPFVEAVIAKVSGLHTLQLIGVYLAPAFAALSMLAVFELGRAAGLSRGFAYLAAISQLVSLLFLGGRDQAGRIFFTRLTEDKVIAAFLLAPVLFRLVIDFLDDPEWPSLSLLIFGGLALSFAHPTILGVASAILATYGLIELIVFRKAKAVSMLFIVLVAIASMQFSLRFHPSTSTGWQLFRGQDYGLGSLQQSESLQQDEDENDDWQDQSGWDPRRIKVIYGTRFHGANPNLIWSLPFQVAIAGGVLALFQLRKSRAARYIVASLIVVGFAIIPYTGWILGLAITPYQLWRVPWLTPFGVSIAFLVGLVTIFLTQMSIAFLAESRRREVGLTVAGIGMCVGLLAASADLIGIGDTSKFDLLQVIVICVGALIFVAGVTFLVGMPTPESVITWFRPASLQTKRLPELEWPERHAPLAALAAVGLLLGAWIILCKPTVRLIPLEPGWEHTFDDYVYIGYRLDELVSEEAVVIGDNTRSNMYVPSLSAKANAIVFRSKRHTLSMGRFSRQEVIDRMAAWEEMIADDTPSARRVELFQDHQVEFILIGPDRAWMRTLVTDFPERFSLVGKSGELRLYQFTFE